MPRLLLTNNQLHNFGGSEMVTLELAEEFLIRGWYVDVYTHYLDTPFAAEFDSLTHRDRLRVTDVADVFGDDRYDLIWVHQSVLPPPFIHHLAKAESSAPIVWHHMSSFVKLEAPILADIELATGARISTLSAEAVRFLSQYGIPPERVSIFPNPVPRAFTEAPVVTHQQPLRSICIVSNHIPAELAEATEILMRNSVSVVTIGGNAPARVLPQTLAGFDAVITIGKTTQFALALGMPSYEYDIHGGCGWLSAKNLDEELSSNFSGRTTGRKLRAEEIAVEIVSGFEAARDFAQSEVSTHRRRFSLQHHIDEVLKDVRAVEISHALSAEHATRWAAHAELQRNYYRSVTGAHRLLAQTREELAQANQKLKRAEARAHALATSTSFRLGSAVVRPLAKLSRGMKDDKTAK